MPICCVEGIISSIFIQMIDNYILVTQTHIKAEYGLKGNEKEYKP
jgi:hypothetical protein